MKLSIIVPVYNVLSYLPSCLESLVNQTVSDYEIILVDDGSTDGSADIVLWYAQRYPDLVRTMRVDNGGQGRARNFGLGIAQGDFVGFADSDDWVERDMYEKLLSKAETEDADLVCCDFIGYYADGHRERLPAALQDNKMSAAGSACNKLFKRSLIGEERFPEGLWYEDFAFSAKLLMNAKNIQYVPEALYCYRCGQESTMHNNNARKNLDIIAIFDGIENAVHSQSGEEDFRFLLINHLLLDSINRLSMQSDPEKGRVIRQLRSYVKKHIPNLSSCESFKRESLNRRVIMTLNYHGLEGLSKLLLTAKKTCSIRGSDTK